jgi:hypothetical protein
VTKGIEPESVNVELALSKTFLPSLFGAFYDEDDPCHSKLACLPVKSGLVWLFQTLLPLLLSQIMMQAFCFALLFWPPFEATTLFDQLTTWRSSQRSKLNSNFAIKQSMNLK